VAGGRVVSPHVLAFDLSLANAGAATLTDTGRVDTWLKQTDPIRWDGDGPPPLQLVCDRLTEVVRWALDLTTTGTRLVVLEGPAFAAQHGQPDERSGLRWRLIRGLHARGLPVGELSPKTMKGYIVGKGNASKTQVQRAVAALYPGQGLDRISGDEADAVGLAIAGADWLGWDGPYLEGRRGTGWLRKARWPTMPDPREAAS
jgi:hypothetical protein